MNLLLRLLERAAALKRAMSVDASSTASGEKEKDAKRVSWLAAVLMMLDSLSVEHSSEEASIEEEVVIGRFMSVHLYHLHHDVCFL